MGNRVRFMSKWKTIQLISRKIQRVHSSGIFKKKSLIRMIFKHPLTKAGLLMGPFCTFIFLICQMAL